MTFFIRDKFRNFISFIFENHMNNLQILHSSEFRVISRFTRPNILRRVAEISLFLRQPAVTSALTIKNKHNDDIGWMNGLRGCATRRMWAGGQRRREMEEREERKEERERTLARMKRKRERAKTYPRIRPCG